MYEKIKNMLIENNCDAILINEKVTKRYLGALEGSGCHLFVTQKETYLILDGRYKAEAQEIEGDWTIILWNPQDEGSSYLRWIIKFMKDHHFQTLGVESSISIQDYQTLDSVFCVTILSEAFEKLRMIKQDDDILRLKKAISLTDDIYERVLKDLEIGMTDYEISATLQYYSICAGADKMSFDTIINLGQRSAFPHGRPVGKRIEINEIIMIDFGLQIDGFQSDMTRISSFGQPSSQMQEIYDVVLEANHAGAKAMKAGVPCYEVDQAAREVIEKAGYGEFFTHGLGHGIGMDNATELPKIHGKSEMILEEGMVMSCEPGIYIPGVGGIRIEDNIWIKDGIGVQLNETPQTLRIL